MAVSKRLRYEILRRDNHQCRYCGATAPEAPLTVDHVVPVALGGVDDPSNLATACRDCNAGKSASSPDAPIVAQVKADALVWAAAMQVAAEERAAATAYRRQLCDWFITRWNKWS
ncbi:HNH endonuclease, partial [Williamsia deligens]